MSGYVPTNWQDVPSAATPITAAELNRMEAGIVAGIAGGGSTIEYENAWSAGVPYTPGDVVSHGGIEYLAVNPSTGVAPTPAVAASLPAGVVSPFAGATPPTGYLLCDGTGYSTTTYAALFAAIAYAYGGSGGTFNVPDLRGRVPVGKGTNAAVDVLGENDGVAESLRRPQHRHSPHAHVVGGTNQVGGGQAQMPSNSNNQVWGSSSVDGGSGVGTDPLNAPAYIVLNYIIKT